jgi:hypothetical protein
MPYQNVLFNTVWTPDHYALIICDSEGKDVEFVIGVKVQPQTNVLPAKSL